MILPDGDYANCLRDERSDDIVSDLSAKRWMLRFARHQAGNYNFKWSILISDRPGEKTLIEDAEIQFAYQPVSTIRSRFFFSFPFLFFTRFDTVTEDWRPTVPIARSSSLWHVISDCTSIYVCKNNWRVFKRREVVYKF